MQLHRPAPLRQHRARQAELQIVGRLLGRVDRRRSETAILPRRLALRTNLRALELRRAGAFDLVAKSGESEGDFKVRVGLAAREARDAEIAALRKKYAAKCSLIM